MRSFLFCLFSGTIPARGSGLNCEKRLASTATPTLSLALAPAREMTSENAYN
jgi:hypothetical protein